MERAAKIISLLLLFLIVAAACGHRPAPAQADAMNKFEAFRKKEKFLPDPVLSYPGLPSPATRETLAEKINQAAGDFEQPALRGKASDAAYLNCIRTGLQRFENIPLGSEETDRICTYFEELMDMVGMESSGGMLNNFRYGFDPGSEQ